MRKAKADPLRRNPCYDVRDGQDSDENRGGVFTLHARRFYTRWRTVRQQHGNSSGEWESLVHGRVAGKDVKAIAYKPGLADSSIAEATYVYESPY